MLISRIHTMIEEVEREICQDRRKAFICAIKNQQERDESDGRACNSVCTKELLRLICVQRAVKCAAALLTEIGQKQDVNVALDEGGLTTLHLAAQNLSDGLTKLFMEHGAQPNMCYDDDTSKLPLSLALRAFSRNRCVTDWSAEKSLYKLVYIFYLEEMKEPLNTIEILASSTEHLERISLRCAKKGEVAKLAALLLFAWDKLVTPYAEAELGVERCPIWQGIMKELRSLSIQELVKQCSSKLVLRRERKTILECSLKMLKLLEEIRDDIERHRKFHWAAENHEIPYKFALRIISKVTTFTPRIGLDKEVHMLYSHINE